MALKATRTITMRRLVLVVFFIGVVLVPAVVAYQRSGSPHLPHVTVTSTGGPGPHEWRIGIASSGTGRGVASIVVQHPNGHREQVAAIFLAAGSGGGPNLDHLASGGYRYAVYAVPVRPKGDLYWLPTHDLVAKNLIASGSFTIY